MAKVGTLAYIPANKLYSHGMSFLHGRLKSKHHVGHTSQPLPYYLMLVPYSLGRFSTLGQNREKVNWVNCWLYNTCYDNGDHINCWGLDGSAEDSKGKEDWDDEEARNRNPTKIADAASASVVSPRWEISVQLNTYNSLIHTSMHQTKGNWDGEHTQRMVVCLLSCSMLYVSAPFLLYGMWLIVQT